jgi:acetylornithine deacetylase/succinyl-diaminopimelate desuccinylase-like protein
VAAELQAIVDRLAAGDPEFRGEVQPTAFELASAVDPDAPIVRAATAALRDLGLDTEPIGMAGATDARILDEAGVPAIVFGPGDLALAHSTAERIPVAELTTAARAFARLFAAYLAPA